MSLKNIHKKILKNKNFKLGNIYIYKLLLENKKKNEKEKRKNRK